MDKSARIRWVILSLALAATVAASVYPESGTGPDVVAPQPARPGAAAPAIASAKMEPVSAARAPDWLAADVDPFAPRGWLPPPPVPEAPRTVQALEVAVETPPPPPPPLPYAFVGQMSDGDNRVVYLSRGEQLLVARAGEALESTYKVVLIDKSHIEFETIASGLRQSLSIPAQDR